ncbi:MAG: cyclic nucleotide-binding domain-containing protein [Bacteroidetes bacterium]|nr:cyclic nucleotide-binding domain-containing protein [Bacteroidota bacterium]
MTGDMSLDAFLFGIISAISLPLGAITLLMWRPNDKWTSGLMAFGGGALLAALTIDLVGSALEAGHFYPLAAGCILGGLFYMGLNAIINSQGGFLRKAATTLSFLRKKKLEEYKELSDKLSHIPLFHHLPPEQINSIVPNIVERVFPSGTTILRQGEPGDSMYIIVSGTVDIINVRDNMKKLATLHDEDVLGEMALVTGAPRSATAVCTSDVKAWMILKENFDQLISSSVTLQDSLRQLVESRILDLKETRQISEESANQWAESLVNNLKNRSIHFTDKDVNDAAKEHGGAPLAIWLGILLDGIPESLVIGSSIIHSSISFSLLAGLFLSNYPEALSSSAGMKHQGYSFNRIFWMWMSLCIITGLGAYVGNIFFIGAPPTLFAVIEGLAAGAMLTMIAETMLPEAFEKGGSITGIATLMGFLAAIFFKTLE